MCERVPFNGPMLFLRTVNTQRQQRVRSMWKELFFLRSCNITHSSPGRGTTGVNLCALVNVLCELAINLCQASSNGDRRRDLYTRYCCCCCCGPRRVYPSRLQQSANQPADPPLSCRHVHLVDFTDLTFSIVDERFLSHSTGTRPTTYTTSPPIHNIDTIIAHVPSHTNTNPQCALPAHYISRAMNIIGYESWTIQCVCEISVTPT